MKRFFASLLFLPFWASRNSSIYEMILQSSGWSAERRAKSLEPGFPREDPVEEPPVRPVRPIPTDVPVPEPRDIPIREPCDVPPPAPGVVPTPIRPLPTRPDSKPRPSP